MLAEADGEEAEAGVRAAVERGVGLEEGLWRGVVEAAGVDISVGLNRVCPGWPRKARKVHDL